MKRKFLTALFTLLVLKTLAATNEVGHVLPPCCRALAAAAHFTDKSIYQLDSLWTSDAGTKMPLGTLRGRPQVVAMFFSSCRYTCPLTVGDMKNIEAVLPENLRTNVGFTLISFDSQRDTPEALRTFRTAHQLSNENWTLLRGEPDEVRELAALLGIVFRQDTNGDFAHSNVITILNSEGEIVFQQQGINLPPDTMIAKLRLLARP